jgi:nucleoside-diphosphate-sugar epimerase
LVQELEQRGDTVVGLVRFSSNLERLSGCLVKLVYGDIGDRIAMKAIASTKKLYELLPS